MEIGQRIRLAEVNRTNDVNCASFWAYIIGLIEQENWLRLDDQRIKRELELSSKIGSSAIYDQALTEFADFLIINVYHNSLEKKASYPVHFAMIDPVDPTYVYHRMASNHPVLRVTGEECLQRYTKIKDPYPDMVGYPGRFAITTFYRKKASR